MKKITLFIEMIVLVLFNSLSFGQGTWSLQTNPTNNSGESMQFVSATEGWIGLDSNGLLHTTNSGSNWNLVVPNSSDAVCNLDVPGSRLSFANATTGWVIKTIGTPNAPGGVILYKTTNSGSTWTRSVLSTTTGDAAIQIQFVDVNTGWLLIYNMISGTPTFLKTTNGGSTWSPFNGAGIFHFVSTTVGYSFSAGPNLLPPYTIYKTTDGGTNWSSQYVDNTSGELEAIEFSDATHGWIVGNKGKILKTTDGTNWTTVTNAGLNANYDNNEVRFINNNTGWIATNNYNSSNSLQVLKTTNGGASWTVQNTPFNSRVYSLDFWDANIGWLTVDGGPIGHYIVTTGSYSDATLSGPWLFYTDLTPIDPFNDNLNYFVFNGNGSIIDFNGFGGPWYGNYTVSASGIISATLSNGTESFSFSGQLSSTTDGTGSLAGQNWKFHKVSNPGALKDKITGTLTTDNCGSRSVIINIDVNGQITSSTGLNGPVIGRVYTDLGVYIGHMTTGETSPWNEISIMGYYNNNNLVGQLGLDSNSCTNELSNLVRSDNLGINDNYFGDKNIIIYPNPNNGSFHFDIKNPKEKLQIEIYNQLGQRVYQATNIEQKVTNEIYFEPQSKGIYFIKIFDGNNTYKDKLIIN